MVWTSCGASGLSQGATGQAAGAGEDLACDARSSRLASACAVDVCEVRAQGGGAFQLVSSGTGSSQHSSHKQSRTKHKDELILHINLIK